MNRTEFYLHPRSRHGISHAAALCGCLLLLAACGTDDGAPDMPQAGRPIGFSTNVEGRQNRSGELTAANLLSTGIFAYYTGSDDWTAADTPNFMYNQEVKRTDASSPWTYSPVKYWPNNPADKISFFAYAPYNAAGVTPCGNTVAGFPYLDYTVPTAEAGQTDLLVATPLMNQSYANTPVTPGDPTTQGKISFNMQHALTKISIYAKSSDLSAGKVVNSLSVTAPKSGRLTYKADGFGWSSSTDKSTYTATNTDVTIAPAIADGTVLLGTFYLIPDRANSSLNITYTLTGSISDNVNPPTDNIVITAKAFPDTYDWTPGTSINYTVNIGRTGLEIVAESSSMEWTNGATNKIELYNPTQLKLGDYYYSDGSWSDGGLRARNIQTEAITLADPLPEPVLTNPETNAARTCIGIVFYVGRHPTDNCVYLTKTGGNMEVKGYVVSLTNLGESYGSLSWVKYQSGSTYKYLIGTSKDRDDYKGYSNTQQIKVTATEKGHWNSGSFQLAYAVLNTYTPAAFDGSSNWYMPSLGQLKDLYKYRVMLKAVMTKVGSYTIQGDNDGWYWSSTESDANNAWVFTNFNNDNGTTRTYGKEGRDGTRPVLTF